MPISILSPGGPIISNSATSILDLLFEISFTYLAWYVQSLPSLLNVTLASLSWSFPPPTKSCPYSKVP
ncbi:hypothetical protein [Clostridioides difficile]|uniref:hypothetical protein n=1 Tax=Clostridioides difficile TaxID=1496 RepID=UPI001EDAEC38|nr:hypothetical protein [Clostridioides difficile]MDL5068152.1 hypothetical protein [Clostridioides difficile]